MLTFLNFQCVDDFKHTVVLIEMPTQFKEHLVVLGGRPECLHDCNVDITLAEADNATYPEYSEWAEGVTSLDWAPNHGQVPSAQGIPMTWTTNNKGAGTYSQFNSFGPHYWQIDIDMDCTQTLGGWFAIKALKVNEHGHRWDLEPHTKLVFLCTEKYFYNSKD